MLKRIQYKVNWAWDSEQSWEVLKTVVMSLAVILLSFWFTFFWDWLFENPYCNFMFRCGCTFNILGGWARCNVHNTSGPRCPLCAAKGVWVLLTKYWLADFLLMGMMWFVLRLAGVRPWRAALCVLLFGMIAYFVLGFIDGLFFYLISDYPHFIF